MSYQDFKRYTAKQIAAHCQNNERSLALNPALHQTYALQSQARAARARLRFDEEVRAFRTWRTRFIVPRREAWGHVDEASVAATRTAQQSALRLHTTWSALEPFLSVDEREALLDQTQAASGD
jgi:hypothetical protein